MENRIKMKNMETLKKYLETINKNDCPCSCKFRSEKEIEIALVPPPDEILGIIISRDPTADWWYFYKYLKTYPHEDIRRKMLFSSAIPLSLINKVLIFMKERIKENDEKNLFDLIFNKVYWTHLHKCFTDSTKDSLKFRGKNAKKCANKWLKDELRLTMANNDTKFIIALGNDVQRWLEGWKKTNGADIEIIKLPHPSGQNNSIWYRSKKEKYKSKIEGTWREIEKLILRMERIDI